MSLPDSLEIRPICPSDRDELVRALHRLTPETRHKRFLAAKPGFSSSELTYLTEVDGDNHLALVAVDRERRIVGVARCVRDRERPDRAEFAIVVGDALQGRGVGAALARRLARAAVDHGIRHFTGVMLPDNQAPRRLMAALGTHVSDDHIDSGLREVVVELAV